MSEAREPTRAAVAVGIDEETFRRRIEVSERRYKDAKIATCLPALVTR